MTPVQCELERIKESLNRDLLERLTPPGVPMSIERFDGLGIGDEIHLRIGLGRDVTSWIRFGAAHAELGSVPWVARIVEREETTTEFTYTDEGFVLPPPLKSWRHKHRFIRRVGGGCWIRDEIEYSTGQKIIDLAVYPVLFGQFAWRQPIYRREFGSAFR